MEDSSITTCVSMDIALSPVEAFDVFIEELAIALSQGGMALEAGPNGRVTEEELEVGRVVSWEPGELVRLQWHLVGWPDEEITDIEMRFEPIDGGTRVQLVHRGWGGLIGDKSELVGWFANTVAAPFLQATAPVGLGNWLTDRQARRRALSTAIRSTPIPTSV